MPKKQNYNKKPHLNPKNGRRKSALALLEKQVAAGGYHIFGESIKEEDNNKFIKYTPEKLKAKQQEIAILKTRIVN